MFGVAAVWERSEGGDDDVIEGFSIITVPANPLLERLDSSGPRMPAILRRKDYSTWLSGHAGAGEGGAAHVSGHLDDGASREPEGQLASAQRRARSARLRRRSWGVSDLPASGRKISASCNVFPQGPGNLEFSGRPALTIAATASAAETLPITQSYWPGA